MKKFISALSFASVLLFSAAALAEQPAPGDPAPDFELRDQDGKLVE